MKTLINILYIIANLAVLGLSVPLWLIWFIYWMITTFMFFNLFRSMIAVVAILCFGLYTFHLSVLCKVLETVLHYYARQQFLALLAYQINHLQLFSYQNGIILVLLPLFTLRIIIACIKHEKAVADLAKNQAEKQQVTNDLVEDGTLLGTSQGQQVIINDEELNHHALILGSTGVGKTTTMLNFVASYARRNLPIIYLDGKGSFDLIERLGKIALMYNRVFKVFMLRPNKSISELAGYNPFASGSATEWKNRIMALFAQAQNKGQEHFALAEETYINLVTQLLYAAKLPLDLTGLFVGLENPDSLINLAREVDNDLANKLITLHSDKNLKNNTNDIAKLLELFIVSDYGYLFDTVKLNNVIKLNESMQNGEIVLFLFDAATYPEDTSKLAKMVINDINSNFASLQQFRKCLCVFDEFASYASSNLADSISLQRSKGLHAIIGSQSLATVKLKNADTMRIAEELIACCNTYIIQRLNHAQDAEMFAKILGNYPTYAITTNFSNDPQINLANRGSMHPVDKYKISPDVLKELSLGQAVVYRKIKNSQLQVVEIVPQH